MNSVKNFQDVYNQLDRNNLDLLKSIYSDDIQFIDPIHEINGYSELKSYFESMYSNSGYTRFIFGEEALQGDICTLQWRMELQHKKLNRGRHFSIDGISILRFDVNGKVYYHRDYYDLGALIYERIPLIGSIISYIKGRLAK